MERVLTPVAGLRDLWVLPEVVGGAWGARRRLAAALRALAERCVRAEDEASLELVAEAVEAQVRRVPLGATSADAFRDGSYFAEPRAWVDRGALAGRSNPLAPPLHLGFEGGAAVGEVVLGEVHVGAPGMAHGGVIAACFDQLCGHCVTMHGLPSLTTRLDVRYHRPTRVGVPLRLRATLTSRGERHVEVHGTCADAGGVTADVSATFVVLDPERAAAVIGGSEESA